LISAVQGRGVAFVYRLTSEHGVPAMNRTLPILLLLVATVLSGCASSSPQLRPYSAEETRELALEALNRRGLSFDEYHAKKAELLGPSQQHVGFDKQGEMSVERTVPQPGRPS
jgi:hypothetical protein